MGKKLYYSLENKWYDFVENTGLYKITDKIDKFMPSFIFFMLLVIMIIAGVFLLLPTITGEGEVGITFKVIDDSRDPVPLAPVSVSTIDNFYTLIANEDGITRKINIPKNTEYTVDIDFVGSNYETFSIDYFAEDSEQVTIYLTETTRQTTTRYTVTLIDTSTKQKINANGRAEFTCSNPGAIAPAAVTITNGVIDVNANSNCQLRATSITLQGYDTRHSTAIGQNTTSIDLQRTTIDLKEAHPLHITVNGEGGAPLTGVTAALYANGVAIAGKTCVTLAGVCSITGVETGNYVLKVTDTRVVPEYGSTNVPITITGTTNRTVTLTRTIAGDIRVKVRKANGQAVEGANTKLKYGDTEIYSGFLTDANGLVTLPVYDLTKTYRVVVVKEGYMIASQSNVTASATTPIIITLQAITPQTVATLKIRVLNSETAKGFSHAQVVLYDAKTGFLTDYDSQITNSDGNCTFRVSAGRYYAKAFRGSSSGISDEFDFDVRNATDSSPVIIPIEVVKGTLRVSVVNNYGEAVSRANIILFDKYSSRQSVWGGDLANIDGTYDISELTADTEVYAVVSDIQDNLGMTQSEYVYIRPGITNDLKVTLYPKVSALQKPQIQFLGFFNDSGNKLNGYLRAGGDYKAKFLLLVPQERDRDDEFQEVGAVIRTGSTTSTGISTTPYMENDSIYLKSIDLPNSEITKYTQYSSEVGYDGIEDEDTITQGDAKWAKVVFNEIYGNNFANAYTIMADVKIRDSASYGERVNVSYLGFGYNEDDEYETDPNDNTNNNDVEYMTYKTESFNIGEEQACSKDFCFTLNITDLYEDIRKDVVSDYTATPHQHYKLRFGLINNNKNRIHNNSRLELENKDKGLTFESINITQPNGVPQNITPTNNIYEYKIPVERFDPHTTLSGEINFVPVLKGDRQFVISFVSDQQVIFTKLVVIQVLSDKTFTVKVTPDVIPSGKNFNLQVEVKDSKTGIEVENPVTVRVKDRFKRDLLANPVRVGPLGIASVNNIPGQQSGDKIYVYVEAPEYETSITEKEVTENIFKITPTRLGVSLNINTKPQDTTKFTLENLSENELTIESIKLIGNDNQIDVIDVQRINNSLAGYFGTVIPGFDSSETANNYNNKQEIEARFFTSPRVETIREVRNISSKLIIQLKDKYNKDYVWEAQLPTTIAVGYEGLMDNPNCITLSDGFWEATVVDNYVDKQFTLKNNCGVKERPVPLNGGLSAKVEFEGNPLGRFTVNVGNRGVELSHGYFKNIYDTIDQEKSYNVNIRYTPVGRYTGDIKGKIIFRSVNATSSGNQELITEYKFVLHVVSLKDCYTVSKKVLTAPDTGQADVFVIENKGCGAETIYRLSCDECTGLVISPKEDIKVSATGTSEEIKVMSMGAMPGMYILNLYSKIGGARGHERNVGRVRVEVRPVSQCLDLDRYEYDLYRYAYSEGSGQATTAKSFDIGNLINRCYGQDVKIKGTLSDGVKWRAAGVSGLRDGVFTGLTSALIKKIIPNKKANTAEINQTATASS